MTKLGCCGAPRERSPAIDVETFLFDFLARRPSRGGHVTPFFKISLIDLAADEAFP